MTKGIILAHWWSDMLQPRDLVPHFEVTDLRGERVQYSSFWQRKPLVLVTLPDLELSSRAYAGRLTALVRESDGDTEWVVTSDRVSEIPCPSVVVADRWGEVVHVAHATQVVDLPTPNELLEWVDYVQRRCPECEGEVK